MAACEPLQGWFCPLTARTSLEMKDAREILGAARGHACPGWSHAAHHRNGVVPFEESSGTLETGKKKTVIPGLLRSVGSIHPMPLG